MNKLRMRHVSITLTCAAAVATAMMLGCHTPRERAGAELLERHEFTRVQMGVASRVVLYAQSEREARESAAAAFARIATLDAVMSDYRPDSELSRFASFPARSTVALSDDLYGVLAAAEEVSFATGGAFDVTIGPVTRSWREARRTGRLPEAGTLRAAWESVGFTELLLDREKRHGAFALPGMSLDVGGIGKGYAAQRAVEVLRERGHARCLVALAGDVVAGEPPLDPETGAELPGWRVVVATGVEGGEPERVLYLRNAAVSTSGDAEQFFEIEGVRFSHIIDPRRARDPSFVPDLGSHGGSEITHVGVTVVASRGEWADALDTALTIVGPEWLANENGAARIASLLRRFGGGAAIVEWSVGGQTRSVTIDRDGRLRFAE